MAKYGSQSMFWRFWAAADPTVERFISRDVDSRLMARDAVAVAAWEQSGKAFHVVRDHPSHSLYPMSGGLWGCVRYAANRTRGDGGTRALAAGWCSLVHKLLQIWGGEQALRAREAAGSFLFARAERQEHRREDESDANGQR